MLERLFVEGGLEPAEGVTAAWAPAMSEALGWDFTGEEHPLF